MTGLNIDNQTLIEAAIIITDKNLKILAEGPSIVIHQSDEVLNNMEEWPMEHHALVNLFIYLPLSKNTLNKSLDIVCIITCTI